MPYEAWTSCKPNVSHLQIFGSLGWVHIPKQVWKGKLESRIVKVHLLEWWTDKAKGYRLEDLKSSKLIISQDVQFFEDDILSDLAVIGIDTLKILTIAVDKFVDDILAKEYVTVVV